MFDFGFGKIANHLLAIFLKNCCLEETNIFFASVEKEGTNSGLFLSTGAKTRFQFLAKLRLTYQNSIFTTFRPF